MPDLSFGSYTLPVYLYEDFSYTISNRGPLNGAITKTSGLPAGFFSSTSSNLTFSGNGNSLTAGTTEGFSYSTLDGSGNVATSSNRVPVGTGRFTDLSGNGVSGNAYTFYKNEPIPKIQLKAPFALSTAVSSVPTLPPGLKFYVSGSNLDISGTPLTTLPTSNYLLIGKDAATGSKVVTTSNTYSVSNERIVYNLSGTPIVNMNVGVPITVRTLTAAFPPYPSGGTLKYVWNTFPDGIRVFDVNNSNRTISNNFGFNTTDPSHAFTMSGTPTLAAAYQYANAGVSSATYTIQGTRVSPLPAITSNFAMTFAFNETVLFDQSAIPTVYSGVPIDTSANFFRAKTYFATGGGTAISNIFSPDLRSDLSLNRIGSNAYLFGTPTLGASSANYTIRAINTNGVTQDYVTPITVQDDFITFVSPTPATDTCYNFIVSRPIDVPKNGYYPSPIQFKAQSASGRPVTLSAPSLVGTGLSLDSSGTIVGFPDTPTALTTLSVVATTTGSPATATRNTKFAVLNDAFIFGNVPSSNFNFIQNKAVVPFQIPVTTLSERPVTNFSQYLLPRGLSISPAGVISGTPLSRDVSGTIEIIPSTGYASGSRDFSYNLTPDSVLFIVNPNTYTYQPGDPIGAIDINAVAYSGTSISRYDLSMNPTYGMTINTSNGVIGGTWSDNALPNPLLPGQSDFTINATAGSFLGLLPTRLTANPPVSNTMAFAAYGSSNGNPLNSWLYQANPSTPTNFVSYLTDTNLGGGITDIKFKNNNNPNTNFVLVTTATGKLYRGTTLVANSGRREPLKEIDVVGDSAFSYPIWSKVVNKSGTSTWWIGGSTHDVNDNLHASLRRSDDDGVAWYSRQPMNDILPNIVTRDNFGNPATFPLHDPYLKGGLALAYKDGVLLAGGLYNGVDGPSMLRSTDDATSWTTPNGNFGQECANFNLCNSSTWVVSGSDLWRSVDFAGVSTSTSYQGKSSTLRYSTDQGANWSNTTGDFDMFGYEIAYGGNKWLATGVGVREADGGVKYYSPELRFSTNGINWSKIDLSTNNLFDPSNTTPIVAPLRIGSLNFDGNYWNVLVNAQVSGGGSVPLLYRHDASSSLASGWFSLDIGNSLGLNQPSKDSNLRYLSLTEPSYLYVDYPPSIVTLSFTTSAGVGPTINSPTNLSFLEYQYVPIQPIQLSATGVGTAYFFVQSDDLPPGLVFDPLTNQITGKPAQVGLHSTTVYAKDNNGVSSITLSFNTLIPRIIRKQDGAGAYTSLLRQYTNVLGAQNARDNRVLPNQTLGEFMAPDAPDVITATIDPKCRNPNC